MVRPPSTSKSPPKVRQFSIPEAELSFSFARSGGPGGQNVNKVETKVTVTFNFTTSHALTWEEKGRLGKHPLILKNLDSDGSLSVTSQAHRSQALNREDAVKKLHELVRQALKPKRRRIPTKKTKGSQMRRLESKKAHGQSKAARRRVADYGDD